MVPSLSHCERHHASGVVMTIPRVGNGGQIGQTALNKHRVQGIVVVLGQGIGRQVPRPPAPRCAPAPCRFRTRCTGSSAPQRNCPAAERTATPRPPSVRTGGRRWFSCSGPRIYSLHPQTVFRLHWSLTPSSFSRRRLMCTSTVRNRRNSQTPTSSSSWLRVKDTVGRGRPDGTAAPAPLGGVSIFLPSTISS